MGEQHFSCSGGVYVCSQADKGRAFQASRLVVDINLVDVHQFIPVQHRHVDRFVEFPAQLLKEVVPPFTDIKSLD